MKKLYTKTKDDMRELAAILETEPELQIADYRGDYVIKDGKQILIHKAWINGEQTALSFNLVKFLKEKGVIEAI